MKKWNKSGSVLLMVVFAVALLSVLVAGMLHANTEELMLMKNHVGSEISLEIALAGLNAAFAEIRSDSSWSEGFKNKPFGGGSYDVIVTGTPPKLDVNSISTSAKGFKTAISAEIVVSNDSPYIIRVDRLRINE